MSDMRGWPFASPAKKAKVVQPDYDDSAMVCLKPDENVRSVYAEMDETTESPEELHITLLYLGSTEDCGGDMGRDRLYRACYGTALAQEQEIKGKINGLGWFMNGDLNVLIALWDLPYLSGLRESLRAQCVLHGVPLRAEDHGFTPHMTLGYDDECSYKIPRLPEGGSRDEVFESIWLVWAGEWQEIKLT